MFVSIALPTFVSAPDDDNNEDDGDEDVDIQNIKCTASISRNVISDLLLFCSTAAASLRD